MRCYYLLLICLLLFLLTSCNQGYERQGERWAWVSYNEAVGKDIDTIESADVATFRVLSDERYAVDKEHAYYEGTVIEGAGPARFEPLGERYAKDANSVFLEYSKVLLADPRSFEILAFPYARDNKYVFCGTIPVVVQNVETVEVLQGNGLQTTTSRDRFIEQNPDYAWMDSLDVETVIYGSEAARGRTPNEEFAGMRKVN